MPFFARKEYNSCVERGRVKMKRLLFIYNPRAGKEFLRPAVSDIVDILIALYYETIDLVLV